MRRLYLSTVLLGAMTAAMSAWASSEKGDYAPGDFVYKYYNYVRGEEWTDSVGGTEEIAGNLYDLYAVTPSNYYFLQHNQVSMSLNSLPPVRKDEDRVMMWLAGREQSRDQRDSGEVTLYDFSLGPGDVYGGFVDDMMSNDERRVTATRTVGLFGARQRVLGVVSVPLAEDVFNGPYTRFGGIGYLPGEDGGDYFVVVENVGAVTLPGYYSWPATQGWITSYPPEDPDCPRLSEVCTRDGKYRYSRLDLGVRAYNQLVATDPVWVYYSETPEAEAVHYMSFSGMEECDGQSYGLFSASRVILRDKATGEITDMVNPDRVGNSWLMRESLGQVYVRDRAQDTDRLLYDYMVQTGGTLPVGDGEGALEAVVLRPGEEGSPEEVLDEPVKSYSFAGHEGRIGVTEFIGLWGEGTGCLAQPKFAGLGEGNVSWPWAPASDGTLARVYISRNDLTMYMDQEVYDTHVKPLMDSAGVVMGTAAGEDGVRWYTLQGMPVSAPERGQVLIRVTSGRAEKVRY